MLAVVTERAIRAAAAGAATVDLGGGEGEGGDEEGGGDAEFLQELHVACRREPAGS